MIIQSSAAFRTDVSVMFDIMGMGENWTWISVAVMLQILAKNLTYHVFQTAFYRTCTLFNNIDYGLLSGDII